MANASPFSARAGFTLLELLLAVAAFALVLAAINGVFYGALRLRNKTVAVFDAALPVQQTLTILRRDLANIVVPGGTLFGPLQTTATTGLNSSLGGGTGTGNGTGAGTGMGASGGAATLSNQGMVLGQSSPAFYTATGVLDETSPFAEVQKVSYALVPPTNTAAIGKDLIRSVTRNLLPSLQEQSTQQALLSGVQTITFLFHDGSQWREAWDSSAADQPRLPLAIKVQLQMAAEQGDRLPSAVELVVPLLIDGGTNLVAESTGEAL